MSNTISYGKKGIKNTLLDTKMMKKLKTFCIKLQKMNGYAKCFDETKYMNFFIEVKTLLKAFN